jgi:hypothetical protein
MSKGKIILIVIVGFIVMFTFTVVVKVVGKSGLKFLSYNLFIPSSKNNLINDEYTKIPDTKLAFLIPDDFKLNEASKKIENYEDVYIQILEMNGVNFNEKKNEYTKEYLNNKGYNLTYYNNELKINSKPCVFFLTKNETGAFLLLGDKSYSALIIGAYPKSGSINEKDVINCMLSVVYDSTIVFTPENSAKFEIDFSNTNFKFYNFYGTSYNYLENGEYVSDMQPILKIGEMPTMEKDTKKYVENLVNQLIEKNKEAYNSTDFQIISQKDTIINNNNSYKAIIKGTINGKLLNMLIFASANEANTIYIYGLAYENENYYFNIYNNLIKTLKIK